MLDSHVGSFERRMIQIYARKMKIYKMDKDAIVKELLFPSLSAHFLVIIKSVSCSCTLFIYFTFFDT